MSGAARRSKTGVLRRSAQKTITAMNYAEVKKSHQTRHMSGPVEHSKPKDRAFGIDQDV
jgi:hypothetical protein